MKPDILYEDNHILVVDKAPGILTQPSGTEQPNLEIFCKDFLKKRDNKPGNVYLHAVHRLDKPVGGIVLFAKTSKALVRLNADIREHTTRKHYEALLFGRLEKDKGTLENYLIHDNHFGMVVSKDTKKAKLARLHYEVIEVKNNVTRVSIELETGRYHQIRVQFAHIDHPIVGDRKYGSTHQYNGNSIALIHKNLTIRHPTKKKQMNFQTKLFI
ncbi:MAG: RluA family pseudouridine synthase [Chlamydiota bacterium]